MSSSKSSSPRYMHESPNIANGEISKERGKRELQADYAELLENLENSEQTLIEHMRTAGMKKTRECQLIEELLNLRKSRRHVFSILRKDASNTKDCQDEAIFKMNHESSMLRQTIIDLQDEVAKKNYALRNIEKEFKNKLEDVHAKYRRVMKSEVDSVKSSYEKTLSVLETKIEQVQEVSGNKSKHDEEQQAQKFQDMLDDNNRRQNEKHSASMSKYKDALKSLVEKEKKLDDLCRRNANQIQLLTEENKQLNEKILTMAEELTAAKGAVASSESAKHRMEKRMVQLVDKYKQLEASRDCEVSSARSITDDAISSMQARHVHELQLVDERVRRALKQKDQLIFQLQSQLDAIHKESQEAESLLRDLNSNLQPAAGKTGDGGSSSRSSSRQASRH